MIKNWVSILLISFSLSACTTMELIHEPVGCLGQPSVTLGLTAEEYATVTLPVERKVIIFARTLRARIDAQCEINKAHDRLHAED